VQPFCILVEKVVLKQGGSPFHFAESGSACMRNPVVPLQYHPPDAPNADILLNLHQ
jgi:hypothetical protein